MMRIGHWGPVLLAAGLCVALSARPAAAQEDDAAAEELPRVSNIFLDTDLRNALQDLGAQAGVTIIPDPSVGGIVTAEFDDMPLDRALKMVLAGTGYAVLEMDDYYLVYSPAEGDAAFMEVAQTRRLKLGHVPADEAVALLAPGYQAYVRADEQSSTAVITAPPELLDRIEADLRLIDAPPGHVLLHARVVVLEHTDLLNMGVKWDFPQVAAGTFSDDSLHGGGASGASWPWGIRIGYTPGRDFTNGLLLTLNLLSQNDEASIIASPQVLGQDGRDAVIRVTTEEYFEIVTDGAFARSQLEKIETGTILNIRPRITDDGEVVLTMEVEVSDVVARGQSNLPVVSRRIAESTVRVDDGGTAAVAGLMDVRNQNVHSRTPGAGDVPVLGELFRNRRRQTDTRQLAVFVTASIVESPSDAREREHPATIPAISSEQFRPLLEQALEEVNASKQP
ncbi:MAG: hypothetical protein WD534_14075 [Phycisphaeraceae bacterium]